MEGDSGAWVLNDVGNLESMAWAASNTGRTAYMTQIDGVIADVEAGTSKKVELLQA